MDDLNNTTNTAATTAHDDATNQGQAQRDEKGRFSKGNRGGAGNPFLRETAKLRQAALDAVSEDDVRDIINAMKEKAKAGDVAASKLLLSYSMGKPTAAADPDTLDQHELQTIVNNHVRSDASIIHVVQGMPIEVLLIMIRAMLPELFKSKMQTGKEILSAPPADEDDDDDLVFEDDADDVTSGAEENVASAEACVGNDNIPAWMHEMVKANRAVPQVAVAEKPQRGQEKGVEQETALLSMQKQLLDLVNEEKKHRSSAAEQEVGRGQCLDAELLRSLIGRMRGVAGSGEQAASPSPDGLNGTMAQ